MWGAHPKLNRAITRICLPFLLSACLLGMTSHSQASPRRSTYQVTLLATAMTQEKLANLLSLTGTPLDDGKSTRIDLEPGQHFVDRLAAALPGTKLPTPVQIEITALSGTAGAVDFYYHPDGSRDDTANIAAIAVELTPQSVSSEGVDTLIGYRVNPPGKPEPGQNLIQVTLSRHQMLAIALPDGRLISVEPLRFPEPSVTASETQSLPINDQPPMIERQDTQGGVWIFDNQGHDGHSQYQE